MKVERQAVLEALDALPVQSWIVAVNVLRGAGQAMGDLINDDPTPDYALVTACDGEIDRLTSRRK